MADPESTPTVMVVDDEEGVRVPIVRALRRQGYLVLEAEHGEAALARVRDHGAPIDLLLTDVMMPAMNGRDLARTLRASHPTLRVLFMTGYTDHAIEIATLDPTTTAFIEKPFPMARLLTMLRGMLE
ncbi:MAG TPA: response regulator [Gemmatimonadaceae bacterium]|nr:response regulator [Gemmatimonadaceae bacterium]